ncbi:phage virion morphogenesis protein [Alteriqipengyuania flavescens]|uniref:phage virion morphogenesis protein n=1 Tax=Alteriqipengyuania flavescens TaxID=3053610 RepID=UPI0025B4C3AC|nr:phage virion morphogenesis protein [Alteriqipengyuania flavescens]WJY18679.1 phage virion morphogenesis protein [Alteriqipengyuania flavescens]WJY24619.1 phage virion morphogenesis protein [Alteriqipengyuania flavescens]
MSGMNLTIDRSLADQLRRAREEARDLTWAMDRISEEMLAQTRRRFDAEVAPSGVPWRKSKRAAEAGGKTLQDKGFLRRSLDRRSGATYAEVGVRPNGPQETYAAIHQFGGTIRPKTKKALAFGGRVVASVTMPARPYLGFDREDREDIEAILTAHLQRAFVEGAAA